MSTTLHPESSEIAGEIFFQLKLWNNSTKAGKVFGSSGFRLPNGAMYSADCSFVSHKRWAQRSISTDTYPYLVPNFVVEIQSSSHSFDDKKDKMYEWISRGTLLAWLVDVPNRQIFLFKEWEELYLLKSELNLIYARKDFGSVIDGEEVLSGFTFDSGILNPMSRH